MTDSLLFKRELSVLAHLNRDEHLWERYSERLNAGCFVCRTSRVIWDILDATWKKHRTMPNDVEMDVLVQAYGAKKTWTTLEFEEVALDIELWRSFEPTEVSGDFLREYLALQDAGRLGQQLAGWTPNQGLEKLKALRQEIEQLEHLSSPTVDLGVRPFSQEVMENPAGYIDALYGGRHYVSQGFDRFDEWLQGGLRVGELACVLAGSGVGKSSYLLNVGLNSFKAGNRVVYYVLDNLVAEMLERTYATIAQTDIVKPPQERWRCLLQESIRGRFRPDEDFLYSDDFFFKQFASGSVSMDDVLQHFRLVKRWWTMRDLDAGVPAEEAGGRISMAIIDYGDMLKALSKRTDLRHELTDTYTAMGGFAQDEKIAVLSATQGNRLSLVKEIVGLTETSESIGKIFVTGLFMSLSQTPQERYMRQFRVHVLKARRSRCNYWVPFRINYQTLRIEEDLSRPIAWLAGYGLSDSIPDMGTDLPGVVLPQFDANGQVVPVEPQEPMPALPSEPEPKRRQSSFKPRNRPGEDLRIEEDLSSMLTGFQSTLDGMKKNGEKKDA